MDDPLKTESYLPEDSKSISDLSHQPELKFRKVSEEVIANQPRIQMHQSPHCMESFDSSNIN
jgi:hypothetical protein